jgi:hypothetical protein
MTSRETFEFLNSVLEDWALEKIKWDYYTPVKELISIYIWDDVVIWLNSMIDKTYYNEMIFDFIADISLAKDEKIVNRCLYHAFPFSWWESLLSLFINVHQADRPTHWPVGGNV